MYILGTEQILGMMKLYEEAKISRCQIKFKIFFVSWNFDLMTWLLHNKHLKSYLKNPFNKIGSQP